MTSTSATPCVSVLSSADAGNAIATVTLAFANDPVLRWVFPRAKTYLKYFPRVVQAFAGRAFDHRLAHYVEGFKGVGLWLPPGVQPDEEALGTLAEESIERPRQDEVFALLEQMGEGHPAEPHWYLPLLAVDPSQQNRGYGSALLAYGVAVANAAGLPAYLESTSPNNTRLYQRHGFEAVGTIQVADSPVIMRMLRQPR